MKVLLATDGSQFAVSAAAFLARLPHSDRLDLVILSVCEPSYMHDSLERIEWLQEHQDAKRVAAKAACQQAAKMFAGANATVEMKIGEGHVGQQIIHQAQEMGADLIVVGAEGHSMLSRILLGSVSDFVATHANCSVLVIRPSSLGQEDHRNVSICVAYDSSGSSNFATQQLAEFDWKHNAQIQIITALNLPFNFSDQPVQIDIEPMRREVHKSVEQCVAALRELSPDVTGQVVETHHVGDALVQFANRNQVDLIVLGSTGLGLLGNFLLGSVANYVLRHAQCSVWIARNPTSQSTAESAHRVVVSPAPA